MTNERAPARMRLPQGFSRLRDNLGQIIKDHRTGVIGFVGPISQHALAFRVGINRVALSRIENGRAWPQGPTLDRIMAELELDWPEVAIAGDDGRRSRRFDDTLEGRQTYRLGVGLRECRLKMGWSLVEMSRRCGISASHLSRIERGEVGKSAVFTRHDRKSHKTSEDFRVIFGNAVLADLIAGRLDLASYT